MINANNVVTALYIGYTLRGLSEQLTAQSKMMRIGEGVGRNIDQIPPRLAKAGTDPVPMSWFLAGIANRSFDRELGLAKLRYEDGDYETQYSLAEAVIEQYDAAEDTLNTAIAPYWQLKHNLWFELTVGRGAAEVARYAHDPDGLRDPGDDFGPIVSDLFATVARCDDPFPGINTDAVCAEYVIAQAVYEVMHNQHWGDALVSDVLYDFCEDVLPRMIIETFSGANGSVEVPVPAALAPNVASCLGDWLRDYQLPGQSAA